MGKAIQDRTMWRAINKGMIWSQCRKKKATNERFQLKKIVMVGRVAKAWEFRCGFLIWGVNQIRLKNYRTANTVWISFKQEIAIETIQFACVMQGDVYVRDLASQRLGLKDTHDFPLIVAKANTVTRWKCFAINEFTHQTVNMLQFFNKK